MPSKIEVDPLLVALFDLPDGLQVQASSANNRVRPSNATANPFRRRGDTSRRFNQPDDGVETDNTSLLHGETISLTDEEYSDAVAQLSPSGNSRPSMSSAFVSNRTSNITLAVPVRLPAGEVSDEYAARGTHHVPVVRPMCKSPDEYDADGGGTSPTLGTQLHHNITGNRNIHIAIDHVGKSLDDFVTRGGSIDLNAKVTNNQASPKRKKKRRPGAIKSLKKLVGRKSKSSSTAMTMSTSFDEAESTAGSPITDPSSYASDLNTPQSLADDRAPLEGRLFNLKSKIGRIRSDIHSLEGDLIATRNELARAHQQLHMASMELADVQRAALEADIGLSKLVQQQHGGVSPLDPSAPLSPLHFFEADMSTRSSTRSSSSDRLNYFTPTSSYTAESDEESNCYTPRSSVSHVSHDSGLSVNENVKISAPQTGEKSSEDKDRTPLTKNGKPQRKRRFKFDSGMKATKNALTYGMDSNKESNSIGTPSTVESVQDEVNSDEGEEVSEAELNMTALKESDGKERGRQVSFCKQHSFIRAHDLALANGCGITSLLPLHGTDMNDIVNALFEKGYDLANDESDRWTQEQGTGKILSKRAKKLQNGEIEGPMGDWPNAAHGNEVLVWTTKCTHGGHGSEYPMVKARGLIPTTSQQMVKLLLDSGRVKQYNKMSLGRVDEHCFAEGVDRMSACSRTGIHGELKIVRSKSQPPVVRKAVELRLLLHARRLHVEDGEEAKYLTIGRSVWETEHGTAEAEDNSATRCEMLLSVNLIRDVKCSGEQWCEITTITHGVSPGIPISIGKRIGLAAAAKYIRDIRAVFE